MKPGLYPPPRTSDSVENCAVLEEIAVFGKERVAADCENVRGRRTNISRGWNEGNFTEEYWRQCPDTPRNNSSSVIGALEVRVRETEEHLLQRGFWEEVGHEFHAVGADNRWTIKSDKDRSNIDIYRGFIEKINLSWYRREALLVWEKRRLNKYIEGDGGGGGVEPLQY